MADYLNNKKRMYPLKEEEVYPLQPSAMFDIPKLMEAYDYFVSKSDERASARQLFNYLSSLEKDITLPNQRKQP